MEHIIYHSIMSHLNKNYVLSNSQHGFRAGYPCSTQLVSLIEDLNHHMDHYAQIDMILLDFSKAFDTMPHCRLLKKLKFYHIESDIICWIEKWLTAHRQQVLLDGQSSDFVSVSSGVPPGYSFGPSDVFDLYQRHHGEHVFSAKTFC